MFAAIDRAEHGYFLEVELTFPSKRKFKDFLHSPAAFLVSKLRDCEVRYEKLTPEHRVLFDHAKGKEVSSFVQSEAVRKYLSFEEEREAKESGRVLGCRWVLTWKVTPPEDLEQARLEAQEKAGETSKRKAKACIVLLGYQRPDVASPEYRSSAPVQSAVTRHVALQLAVQNQWQLEGLDSSTALLQTEKNQEALRLWTSGTKELREALGVGDGGLLRILKDFYGSTTAPRGLWKDIDATFKRLGAHKILGDPCVWIWVDKNEKPINEGDKYKVIGFMSGHVDDFNRAGDLTNPRWQAIREKINSAYRWGSLITG